MLKFLLLGIMLMCFVSCWELVQVLMFFVLNFHSEMQPWFLWVGLYNGNSLFKVHFNLIKILDSGFNNLSEKVKKIGYFSGGFLVVNLLLMVALMLTFSSMKYLLFYVSFESSLIPTLILILGWGYQPERIQAGVYMLFYTLFASLPLLVCILVLYNKGSSLSMGLAISNDGGSFVDNLWSFSAIFAFIVKLPLYMFHLWLPKAHVEAPVAGSMILAGVLLKLGGYGIIRITPLFHCVNKEFTWVWACLGVVGSVIVSLMCLW